MSNTIEIRESVEGDAGAIESLYPEAFPDENLLPLVRDLLRDAAVTTSFVGTIDSRIVGHAIFTKCGVVADCTGVEDFTGCMSGDVEGFCVFGECGVYGFDCSAVGDETFCLIPAPKGVGLGLCSGGDCLPACRVVEEGAACHRPSYPWELGECGNGSCIPFCENDEDCFDFEGCTADTCLERGLCEFVPVQNGTPCFDAGRTCQSGECVSASP
jgi:hypothetical protein